MKYAKNFTINSTHYRVEIETKSHEQYVFLKKQEESGNYVTCLFLSSVEELEERSCALQTAVRMALPLRSALDSLDGWEIYE